MSSYRFSGRTALVLGLFALGVFTTLGQAANLVSNPSFESPVVPPASSASLTGSFNLGASAATNWSIFNDSNGGTVLTELCAATCPSGATPPAPISGAQTIHIVTGAQDLGDSGIVQFFGASGTGPAVTYNSVWVWVVSGGAEMGTGDAAKGGPNADITTTSTGHWVNLQAVSGPQAPPPHQNEIIVYSFNSTGTVGHPSNFYADVAVADTVPEPGTIFAGALALGLVALYRRRRTA